VLQRSALSFVDAYLNTLPRLYDALPPTQKRDLERQVREWLLSTFQSDLDEKVARTFSTGSIGPLPLVHQFVRFMPELFQLFINGLYYSTIALAGVTAERFCIDLILMTDFKVDGRSLSDEDKQAITEMRFFDLIQLAAKWQLIHESTKTKLHDIRKTRNKYVHPRHPPFQAAKTDAERLIKSLSEIAEVEFGPSATGRYTIRDGAIALRGP
jgi:hypothetical protein